MDPAETDHLVDPTVQRVAMTLLTGSPTLRISVDEEISRRVST